jgi:hypothetical protein
MEASRHNNGKIRLSLVPPSLALYVGAVMTYGALKYDDHNWRKGFAWSSIIDSLERHLLAFKAGETHDEESGLPHLAHLACNAAFLIEHYDQDLGKNDIYTLEPGGRDPLQWKTPPVRPVALRV